MKGENENGKRLKSKLSKTTLKKREVMANIYCYRNSGKSDKILLITTQLAKTRGIKRNINFVFNLERSKCKLSK